MSAVPSLTDGERRLGLRIAVEKRRERALFKALVKSRAANIRVEELLRSMPGIGRASAASIMTLCGIAPNRRVRGLGSRQRERLSDAVAHWSTR